MEEWSTNVERLRATRLLCRAWIKRRDDIDLKIGATVRAAQEAWELDHPRPEYVSVTDGDTAKTSGSMSGPTSSDTQARNEWNRAVSEVRREARAKAVTVTAPQEPDEATEAHVERIADLDIRWLKRAQMPRRKYASRAARWEGAVSELQELIGEYEEWRTKLEEVDNFRDTPLFEKLEAVCGIDLSELESVDLPIGWGKD